MTTIAYDGRILAIDDRACYDGRAVTAHKHMLIERDDALLYVAGTGNLHQVSAIWNWLEQRTRDSNAYPKADDATVIVVDRTGMISEYSSHPAGYRINEEVPHSWGSGAQAALLAMRLFGLTAVEAVKAASAVDVYTSTTGWYLDLTDLERGYVRF